MSFRLAAYAVCFDEADRILLARCVSPDGQSTWMLPGGKVEHTEDPFDAVIREVTEETGYEALVERLLGVDSRTIPLPELTVPGPVPHQNVGIYYRVCITGGELRPEVDGSTVEAAWTPVAEVAELRRSSLVDVGLELARSTPPTGHVAPVPTGGLIRH
jgi:ADP-ribose pyrophosphatase YjhB (NUDIX family)